MVDGTPGANDMPGRLVFNTTADGAHSATERMRIDAVGRVQIGTTTQGQNQADNLTVSDSGNMGITLRSTNSNECSIFFSDATSGTGEYAGSVQYAHSNDTLNFGAAAAGRLRLGASSLNFMTGSLNDVSASNLEGVSLMKFSGQGQIRVANTATSSKNCIEFFNGNGQVGVIATSSSATAYNTSSDYRLKENVDYTWDATTRIKQLKPARFNFISDDTNTLVDGFLAHEAQAVVPECVTGTKDAMKDEEYEVSAAVKEVTDDDGKVTTEAADAVMGTRSVPDMQGIDQSKLVPLLVKTIQELEARITALEDA
jgi:hypothetical protein